MITTPTTTAKNLPEQPAVPSKNGWPPLWRRLALAVVMLISLFMNFYQLGQNGFGNLYYAAAIRSMLDNLHNFFFVAFDPGFALLSPSYGSTQAASQRRYSQCNLTRGVVRRLKKRPTVSSATPT